MKTKAKDAPKMPCDGGPGFHVPEDLDDALLDFHHELGLVGGEDGNPLDLIRDILGRLRPVILRAELLESLAVGLKQECRGDVPSTVEEWRERIEQALVTGIVLRRYDMKVEEARTR